MAFLDNSGDIILDAVLTDIGRKRLAAGRFNIYKFALGDEEINYELWNSNDARGTAFYDLEILQTPILEAFTSDQSLMKSRLVTFSRTDHLYMPIFKVNNKSVDQFNYNSPIVNTDNQFYIVADQLTHTINDTNPVADAPSGWIYGVPGQNHVNPTKCIAIDQGIDSAAGGRNITTSMDEELLETAFIVKVDNRLLSMATVSGQGNEAANTVIRTPQYLDDDYVASYYFVRGQVQGAIKNQPGGNGPNFRNRSAIMPGMSAVEQSRAEGFEMFLGPLGRTLQICPVVKTELQHGTSVFEELGALSSTDLTYKTVGDITNHYYIDTTITVQGMTTGYSIDIPVKIIKGKF